MRTTCPILLVEDNEDDVLLMKTALNEAGVQNHLVVAENGQEAIDYLAGSGPNADGTPFPLPCLVFLDLKLPLKSGHEVLEWIRNEPRLDGLVVIVLTSSNNPADLAASYKLRANSYIVKPSAPEQLLTMAKAFKAYWLTFNSFVPLTG
jgi:CheY-like chemotaxis protein